MEIAPESGLNFVEFKARAYMSQEQKGAFRSLRSLARRGRKKRRGGRSRRAMGGGRRRGTAGVGPGRPYAGGTKPRDVPYERSSRDADGDGLVQEGTIWERPVGSGIHAADGAELADGASSNALPFTTVRNAGGKRTGYKPGDDNNSSLYQGAQGATDGKRRLARGREQVEQAERDRTVKPREQEIEESERKARRRISIVLEQDNVDRMLEAEERVDASRSDEALGFWMSFAEGFTGVRMGLDKRGDKDKKKGSGSATTEELKRLSEGAIVMLGQQRHIADRLGRPVTDEDRSRQNHQDAQILPPDVDRAEHYRKMKGDAAYRKAFILSMIRHDENNDRYVYPPGYKRPDGRTRAGAGADLPGRKFRTKPHTFEDDELEAAIDLVSARRGTAEEQEGDRQYHIDLKAESALRRKMSATEKSEAHKARQDEREKKKAESDTAVAAAASRKEELQKAFDDDLEEMSPDDLREHLAGLSVDELREIGKEHGAKLKGNKDDKINAIVEKMRPTHGPEEGARIDIDDLDPESDEYAERLREDDYKHLRKEAQTATIKGYRRLTDPGDEKYNPEEVIRLLIDKKMGRKTPEEVAADEAVAEADRVEALDPATEMTREELLAKFKRKRGLQDILTDDGMAEEDVKKTWNRDELIDEIMKRRGGGKTPEPVETPEPDAVKEPVVKPKRAKHRDVDDMSRDDMKKELAELWAKDPLDPADADRITALNTKLGRTEAKKPKQKKPVAPSPKKPKPDETYADDFPDSNPGGRGSDLPEFLRPSSAGTRPPRDSETDAPDYEPTPETDRHSEDWKYFPKPREDGGVEPSDGWSNADFSTWSDARLDYEIRRGLKYAGGEYADPIKTSTMRREWESRESNTGRPKLLDEAVADRDAALLEAEQQMVEQVEQNWERILGLLEARNEEFDLPPSSGLPDRQFFDDDDSEIADEFGRYYDPGEDLNDHGLLMNAGMAEFGNRSVAGAETEEAIAEVEQAEAKIIEQARDRKLPRDIDPARVPEDVVGEMPEHAERLIELAGYAQMQKLRNENPDVPDDKLYRLAREVDLGNDPVLVSARSWSWGDGSEIPADMEDLPDETLDRITDEALAEFDRRTEIEQLRTEADPETRQPLRLESLTDKEIEAQVRLQQVGRDRVNQGLEDTGWVKHDPDYLKRLTAERAAREERGDWTDPDLPSNPRITDHIKRLEKEIEEIEAAVAKIKPNQRTHKPKGQSSMSRDRAHSYYGGLKAMKRSRIQQLQEQLDNEGRDAPEADVPEANVPEAPALDVPPADDDGFPYGGEYPKGLEGQDAQNVWLGALSKEQRNEWLRAGVEKQEKVIHNKLVYESEGSTDPDLTEHYLNRVSAADRSPWAVRSDSAVPTAMDAINERRHEAFGEYLDDLRDAVLAGDETESTRRTAPEMFDAAVEHAIYDYDRSGVPTEREAYWGGAMPHDMDPDDVVSDLENLLGRIASDDVLSPAEENRRRLLQTYQDIFDGNGMEAEVAVREVLSDFRRLDEDSFAHEVSDVEDRLEMVDSALRNRATPSHPLGDSLVPLRASVYEALHGEPYPEEFDGPDPDEPRDVRIESWDNLGQEGFEYRVVGQHEDGKVLVETRGGERPPGVYKVKPKPDEDGEYYDPRLDRDKLDASDRAYYQNVGWTLFDEAEWTSAVPRTSPKRLEVVPDADVPEDVPGDSRFTPTLEEGDIRISENVIIHSSNTDDDVRPMLLVEMPDGTTQAFYKRTGSGSEATPGEVEQIEAEGGGGAGKWVPFDGFGGRLGKNWFRKDKYGERGPLFRYGTEENRAAGEVLDASENVQAMLDDPDLQVQIVHSDPSRIGGDLMLGPDDPTIQKTSEELNDLLGLPSTEEYTESIKLPSAKKPKDADVPEVETSAPRASTGEQKIRIIETEEGEWRIHAKNEEGVLLGERRIGEGAPKFVLLEQVREGLYKPLLASRQPHGPLGKKYAREKYEEEGGWQFFDDLNEGSEWPKGGSQESFSFISAEEFEANAKVTKLRSEAPGGDEATRQGLTGGKKKTPKKKPAASKRQKEIDQKKKQVEDLKKRIEAMNEAAKKRAGEPDSLETAKTPGDKREPTVEELMAELEALQDEIEVDEEAVEVGIDVELDEHAELMGDLEEVQVGIEDLERIREAGGKNKLTDAESERVAGEIAALTAKRDKMSEYQERHRLKGEEADTDLSEADLAEAERAGVDMDVSEEDRAERAEAEAEGLTDVSEVQDESEVDESPMARGEDLLFDEAVDEVEEAEDDDTDDLSDDDNVAMEELAAARAKKLAAAKAKLAHLTTEELQEIIDGKGSGSTAKTDVQVVGPDHRLAKTHLGEEVDESLEPRDAAADQRLEKETVQKEIVDQGLWLLEVDLASDNLPRSVSTSEGQIFYDTEIAKNSDRVIRVRKEDGGYLPAPLKVWTDQKRARLEELEERKQRDGGLNAVEGDELGKLNEWFKKRGAVLVEGVWGEPTKSPMQNTLKAMGVQAGGLLVELDDNDLVEHDGKRGFWVPSRVKGTEGFVKKFIEGNWTVVGSEDLDGWLKQRTKTDVAKLAYDSGVDPTNVPGTGARRASGPDGKRTGSKEVLKDDMLKAIKAQKELEAEGGRPLRGKKKITGRTGQTDEDEWRLRAARDLFQDRAIAADLVQRGADQAAQKARGSGRSVEKDKDGNVIGVTDNRSIAEMSEAIEQLLDMDGLNNKQRAELRSHTRALAIALMEGSDEDRQGSRDLVVAGAMASQRSAGSTFGERNKPPREGQPMFDDPVISEFLKDVINTDEFPTFRRL